jgi:predicted NAD-dependent protein-ADP-ribosyltransferase YbiA (DUF1768 family)
LQLKLKYHDKNEEAKKVMQLPALRGVKYYTKSVLPNPSPTWQASRREKMRVILMHKMEQNHQFRTILLDNSAFTLHENTFDTFWAVGRDGKGEELTKTSAKDFNIPGRN